MNLILKGLVCSYKLKAIIHEEGFHGIAQYQQEISKLKGECDFVSSDENTEEYDIVRMNKVLEEREIEVLESYSHAPRQGDFFELDGQEYLVAKVSFCRNGDVVCTLSHMIEENLEGDDLTTVREKLSKELVKRHISNGIKEPKREESKASNIAKRVFQVFKGEDKAHNTECDCDEEGTEGDK